jgi:pyruvate formate lyase activating enzyme
VLKSLERVAQTGRWYELTYLVVPTYNDNVDDIGRMCEALVRALGEDVPMHFSRFAPTFQLKNLPEGSESKLVECVNVAKQAGMNYVYVANLSPHPLSATVCHRCAYSLVERLGVRVLKNDVKDGRCPKCKTRIPGVWE